MTREEFLDLYFDEAIDFITESNAGDKLFSIDAAGELIKHWIDQGEWILADHILHFIANESSGDYFIWDSESGTFSNPVDVSEVYDLEDLADEYGLLESFLHKRTVKESRIRNNGCISMRESDDTSSSPKQLFNKIVSKLRKYAKEHGCYMTIEKFGVYDNYGDAYLYFTTNRYAISGSVQFTFKLGYGKNQRSDWRTYFSVSCFSNSDVPDLDQEVFYSYEEVYDYILDYIIKYGNIDN